MDLDDADENFSLLQNNGLMSSQKKLKTRKKQIVKFKKRISELDKIFKRIYEDDISGAISHERFLKLSADYENKQQELQKQVANFEKETSEFESRELDFKQFYEIVQIYVGIKELTPTVVNEFIKKIIVHAPTNQADTELKRYRLFLTLSVNLYRKTSLSPIKRKFRKTSFKPCGKCFLINPYLMCGIFCILNFPKII